MMRPEATILVNILERRAINLLAVNMKRAKELLIYFFSTKEEQRYLCKPNNLDLMIYTDRLYGAPINISGKLQNIVIITHGSQLLNWSTWK
jgi:hypothetical protein